MLVDLAARERLVSHPDRSAAPGDNFLGGEDFVDAIADWFPREGRAAAARE